ncbi:MAG: peptidase M64 [Calditrichaeota bacterium]|nr:MAG: peptidase M64 [Calditrichota bacterium]MBL1205906.1 peptidase M64 [Calditrichota bacterium]NOG45734.1 peptidase M64 [Calditrichota bacterium]
MKRIFIFIMLLFFSGTLFAQNFSDYFVDKTMRVDYYHSGTKGSELFAIDQIYDAGIWAGSQTNLNTTLNLGEYQVRVFDSASGKMIYSRGYSTIFNEWQTTPDAKVNHHTFHETLLLPMPKSKIKMGIYRRDKKMNFVEKWVTEIDPTNDAIMNKAVNKPGYKVSALMENGPSSEKVDIVIVGDGYTKEEMEQFRKDAKYHNDAMFNTEPFKSRKNDFNVWLVEVVSEESGISKPDKNIWKNNALGCRYYSFNSPRYVLTENNKALRDAAGLVPYDYVNILINDNRYGGGGIYNLYTTNYMRVDTKGQEWQMEYVYVHEFGHSFAGLGDEYYSSSTGYDEFYAAGVEPWEANVTALLDPKNIKWKSFMKEEIPLPTPWEKEEYDGVAAERSKLDRLAAGYYDKREPFISRQNEILENSKFTGKVGAFEGAGYERFGLYRPAANCRMFSLSLVDFDPVCSATLEKVIDYLAK